MSDLLQSGQGHTPETPDDVTQTCGWLTLLLVAALAWGGVWMCGCSRVKAAIVPEAELRTLTGN
jgi:hypothetical protein